MGSVAIYGASGFGSEVAPLVTAALPDASIYFVDDSYTESLYLSRPVVSFEDYIALDGDKYFVVAIANSKVRESLSIKCISAGLVELNVQANNAIKLENVEISDGYILCPFTTITSNVKIGKAFHSNLYSYVAHDCIIGDYVTFAPGVKCNGNVIVEDHAYIGTGAIIKQGTPSRPIVIGKGAVVGMGAVVTKSVAPGATVIGNPAKPLSRAALKR